MCAAYNPPKYNLPIFNSLNFQYEVNQRFTGGIVPNNTTFLGRVDFDNSIVVGNGNRLRKILVYSIDEDINIVNGSVLLLSNEFESPFINFPIITLTTNITGISAYIRDIGAEAFTLELYNFYQDYSGGIRISVIAIESS